ncbi:hypothetical protein IV203_014835 [Nitzschia inconspicua]|uniref:Uncharacterized protein n=1 Tax=Nitzschia inconspicua TaxID=303405 RepID=A0A9K3LB52_9STRA|nr:hypothetical protein IV203_014835 [Nitzschia inconspicua]
MVGGRVLCIHPDMRCHTGATMTLGKGSVYSMSTRQKINTRSSTEAELVGVNNAMSIILWTRHFLVLEETMLEKLEFVVTGLMSHEMINQQVNFNHVNDIEDHLVESL